MPIEEIVVTGKRTPGRAGFPPPAVPNYYDTFERDLDFVDDAEASQEAAIEAYEKSKTIPEIVVTAKKPSLLAAALAMTRSQMMGIGTKVATATRTALTTGIADPYGVDWMFKGTQTKPIEEIIVKGTRLRTASLFASRLAMPVLVAESAGRLGAAIARELQRQAIDELADWATRTDYPGPDTKVRTIPQVKTETSLIPAQKMEEIVVTARRPRPVTFAEPGLTRSQIASFQRDMMTQSGAGISVGTITAPTIPQVKTKTKTLTQVATRTQTLTLPITGVSTRRSTALGIGTGVATGVLTGVATGVATGVITSTGAQTQSQLSQTTRVGQKTKYCKPKPKKARKECWKKLVKEARFESKDKVSKWVKINCDTGRELRKT